VWFRSRSGFRSARVARRLAAALHNVQVNYVRTSINAIQFTGRKIQIVLLLTEVQLRSFDTVMVKRLAYCDDWVTLKAALWVIEAELVDELAAAMVPPTTGGTILAG
jgi:hypothetical protein